ncbi:replicative DNA helicase [Embleya sp. MST-111070]|uniref:replicative DNA helicase n=1 Tax=Embleya sp. MST-111070 TaxID=3398231 RepID=UPI003F734F9F
MTTPPHDHSGPDHNPAGHDATPAVTPHTTTSNDAEHPPWADIAPTRVPVDLRAEQRLLGTMMLSTPTVADCVELVHPDDFHHPAHSLVYTAILHVYARGLTVDTTTVEAELARTGHLDRVSAGYLRTLTATTTATTDGERHAHTVVDRARRRELVRAGLTIARLGGDDDIELAAATNTAATILHNALSTPNTRATAHIGDSINELIDDLDPLGPANRDVLTGLVDLDRLTGGLRPGQLIVIASRPAHGKSTLALNLARHCAVTEDRPVLLFSLQVSNLDIQRRVMSAEGRIPLHRLAHRRTTDDDWRALTEALPRVTGAPLTVATMSRPDVDVIRAHCYRTRTRGGLDLLIVDTIHELAPLRRHDSRYGELEEISRSLKRVARELGIPVVVTAQLNRDPEARPGGEPRPSDVRDCGAPEEDADLVVLINRDDVRDPRSARAGEADLIVAKHRNGPTGRFVVAFQGHFARFIDLATADDNDV